MKLSRLFPELDPNQGETIAMFGRATLIRNQAGQYRLLGGNEHERSEAAEWISLFMHEAVVVVC